MLKHFTDEEIAGFKFCLKRGSIIYNLYDHPHTPGCPQFKTGYYIVTDIREGLTSTFLKPRDKVNYILTRCSKNGKPFKQDFSMTASMFDKYFAAFSPNEYPCTIVKEV